MRKAQAAVELMVVTAFMMMVLFLLFEFGQTKINENTSVIQVSQARNTVDRLARAAVEVHTEGVGARRKIYVTIPDMVNPNRIMIGNGTITLGVYVANGTSDVSSQVGFTIVQGGYFPTTPGSYWVWIISRQGYVQIGSTMEINPLNAYFELFPSNSTDKNITFTNYGVSPINITLNLVWADSEINATINGSSTLNFSLQPGASSSQITNLNTTANSNASFGLHSGYLSVTTNVSESETIPIMVNVVGQPSGLQTVSYMTIETYNDSSYAYSTATFSQSNVIYYRVKSYNSTNNPVNSTVTVKVYDPVPKLMSTNTYSPNGGTGVYSGNYTLPGNAMAGSWRITAYEIGGVSTTMYLSVGANTYGSTIIDLTTTQPFSQGQRVICRDGSNYIHTVWLYNSSTLKYARSVDNGETFTVWDLNSSANSKTTPHISCNGGSIWVAYSVSSKICIYSSTDNGATWSYQEPRTSNVGGKVGIEAVGSRVYILYPYENENAGNKRDFTFFNSSDGGSTWGNDVTIFTAYYECIHQSCASVTYDFEGISINGSGSASDIIYALGQQYTAPEDVTLAYFANSSDSGATWSTATSVDTESLGTPSLASYGANVSISGDKSTTDMDVYYHNSTTYASFSHSKLDIDTDSDHYNYSLYSSVSINGTNPVVFWSQKPLASSDYNWTVVYRSYIGGSWQNAINFTQNSNYNVYVNAKKDNTGNCMEFVYRNGTASPYNIVYGRIGTCNWP